MTLLWWPKAICSFKGALVLIKKLWVWIPGPDTRLIIFCVFLVQKFYYCFKRLKTKQKRPPGMANLKNNVCSFLLWHLSCWPKFDILNLTFRHLKRKRRKQQQQRWMPFWKSPTTFFKMGLLFLIHFWSLSNKKQNNFHNESMSVQYIQCWDRTHDLYNASLLPQPLDLGPIL